MIDTDNTIQFYAALDGTPLQFGQVYFGVSGQNPVTNPITVYWDAAGTQPAAQPVSVMNGRTVHNGNAARVYIPSDYSKLVQDSIGRQISFDAALPAPLRSGLSASGGSSLVMFQTSGASAALRSVQDKLREEISAADFVGFDPSGATDSSAAIAAAIAALPSGGGIVKIPRGTPRFNITITKSGVTLKGPGMTQDRAWTSGSNYCQPWNNANPCIQVGNGAITTGVSLQDLTVYGAQLGTIGIFFSEGAFRCTAVNVSAYEFTTNNWKFRGGNTFPCSLIDVYGFVSQSTVANNEGVLVDGNVGTYTSAINFIGGHMSIGASGHALAIDSCNTVFATNTYIDAGNLTAVTMRQTKVTGPAPLITGCNFSIDSPNSTDTLLEQSVNASLHPADFVRGVYTLDGKMKNNVGTLAGPFTAGDSILFTPMLRGPIVDGPVYFPDPTTDPNWYSDTSASISASGAGSSRQMTVSSYRTNIMSAGAAQDLRLGAGGAYLYGAETYAFVPLVDNSKNLGDSSLRWGVVYAATGAINTSDGREKQQAREIGDAERRVAVRLKGLLRAFKFNDAVQEKGDAARIHFGVIAQDVVGAFAAEGLDATRYAMLCYDEWQETPEEPEVRDENDKIVQPHMSARPAGNRYGVRYDELFAFMLAAL